MGLEVFSGTVFLALVKKNHNISRMMTSKRKNNQFIFFYQKKKKLFFYSTETPRMPFQGLFSDFVNFYKKNSLKTPPGKNHVNNFFTKSSRKVEK
jgi:hypothetical protein